MRINAAVLWEQGRPLSVEPIDIGVPGPGEVLVEMRAAGVCHSDLHPARGDWPMKTPVVLGPQGARIAGAEQIIALDIHERPLALAKQFGATLTIGAPVGVPAAIRELTGGR